METNDNKTKVINNGKKSSTAKKVALGVATIGVAAAGGATADSLLNPDTPEVPVLDTSSLDPNHDENQNENQDDQQATDQATNHEMTSHAEHVHEEPEPMDHSQTDYQQDHADIAHVDGGVHDGSIDGLPDVDPNVVATDITHGELIDPNDNDAPDLAITEVGTIETADGQELSAASLTGDNGEELYMVDIDGDHNYDVVTDADGNVMAEVPEHITESDAESIHDADSGETAQYEGHDDSDIHDMDSDMHDDIDSSLA